MRLALVWFLVSATVGGIWALAPFKVESAPAIVCLLAALWLESRATLLEVGHLSPAPAWTLAVIAIPGLSVPWVLLCLGCGVLLRSVTQPASRWGGQVDVLLDFLPPTLALLAATRLQGWVLLPLAALAVTLAPTLLQSWLAPDSESGHLKGPALVRLSLATLGLVGQRLAPVQPLSLLLLIPAVLHLLRSSEEGSELQQRRAQHHKVRQAHKAVEFKQQVLGEAEARQQALQRLLDARADTFVLLEGLSVRAESRVQALQEALSLLQTRLPGAEVRFLREGEIPDPGLRRLAREQEVWISHDSLQAAWPIPPDGLVWIRSTRPLPSEVSQALQVFFYYLRLLLERVGQQEALRQALESEASMRQHLALAVTRLEAILEGAGQLSGLVQPREIAEVVLERAQAWTGRRCALKRDGWELGSFGPGLLAIQLPSGGLFGIEANELSPAELESLRIWLLLGDAALQRCQAQAALHQGSKLAAVGQLAAGLAHELNTPLGTVSMGMGLALSYLQKDPERARGRLEKAYEALDQMRDILARLLQYSRESGGEQRELCLEQVTQDGIAFVESSFQQAAVALELEIKARDLMLLGNGGELQQILMSLLNNARQAAQVSADPRVRVRVGGDAVHAYVDVEDNGPGVPEEIVERIFEPFFTSRDVGQGLGLGLSSAQEIAHGHRGSLAYVGVSELGGAHFRLTLPRALDQGISPQP